ncbi:MAG: glycosyltransferase [Phycisphaerales bacterium]
MRILHYIDSLAASVGGPARFVMDAARVMTDSGHPSSILTTDPTDCPAAWVHDNPVRGAFPRVLLTGHRSVGNLFFAPAQVSEIRRSMSRVDVLHLHNVWGTADLQLAATARAMGLPYIVSLHGMLDTWSMDQRGMKKRAYLTLGARHMLERAAAVHCTAQAEFDQSRRWFPKGSAALVPYIVDLDPYRDLPGREPARERFEFLRNGRPNLLFLSRVHYKKCPDQLIHAASIFRSHGLDANFIIAGMGDEAYIASLKGMANSMGVGDRVFFPGSVMGQEKFSLYQAADLFVLPTSQENFGLVLIEAMATGTPVVTTKGTDIWRDIQASGGGEIVDHSPVELASSLVELLRDKPRRLAMGKAAREWALTTFDESHLSNLYEGMYGESASTRPRFVAPMADRQRWEQLCPLVPARGVAMA